MTNKEPEFKVTDRRLFSPEGELRPDVATEERETKKAPEPETRAAKPEPEKSRPAHENIPSDQPKVPEPPSQQERDRSRGEYRDSASKLESELRKGYGAEAIPDYDVTFDRLLEPFYLTALMQLGMMPAERGAQPQVDIIGARHTIDTLALLQEKTKGNVTQEEENVLETVIYQLRMRYVELTNAIARSAQAPPPGTPGKPGLIK
jgi:Domain of unknown function (DUF1844)